MSGVEKVKSSLLNDVREIISAARSQAVRSVDSCRVQMYWHIGRRIFEEEQLGKDRADYGTYLIKNLAKQLEPEYGSGFSYRQLAFCRQFYRLYPIVNALRSQLNWTQYRMLIQIEDPDKRLYYELESVNNNWTARETERQINSQLYERLLLSNDKEAVLAVARKERIPQSPLEIIKDPMYLEFLGLEREAAYYEKDFESAIITHLQHFLLELGQGFTFVARQKRILLEDDEFFADLVFYNRLLRCFVVIELKTTIGILLCTDKNDTVVRMALPEDNRTILASEYKLYLPTQTQLIDEVNSVLKSYNAENK